MKKLYLGITVTVIVFGFFLICQNSNAESFNKSKTAVQDSLKSYAAQKLSNEAMSNLALKVDFMEKYVNESQKYVESSQKNLDLWLKYLAFTLSVLIGSSVFTGLKMRELAKEELKEVKKIADDAEERLKKVTEQITQIENTATNAKNIEDKMTNQLNEIGSRTDIILNDANKKIVESSITKAKEDLQKSGIESFKNLYFAKALKAETAENWEEALRLCNNYIDLEEGNEIAFLKRGNAYLYLGRNDNNNIGLLDKAIQDYSEAIRLKSNFTSALYNRGLAYLDKKDYPNVILNQSAVIELWNNQNNRLLGEELIFEKDVVAKAYVTKGTANTASGDDIAALSDYNQAIVFNPNSSESFNNLGNILARKKDYSGALSNYNEAIRLKPDNGLYHYNRYLNYSNMGNSIEAQKDLAKAKLLDPEKFNK